MGNLHQEHALTHYVRKVFLPHQWFGHTGKARKFIHDFPQIEHLADDRVGQLFKYRQFCL